ncbi:hypothetical protein [Bacillus gaemokensis]|uniref:Uncharacterized protein n=1 Tax=Bacillus gaemokensis TaxID=574375 RepID=A0A073KBC9_9BACI|nr:hypothetical protein [Bacillus gaemokensis]KEK24569.1 hypothetical protein BAGA_25830 [Bacillus gaemokensis]KYG39457.1 hypothetical protein AZF08_05365 [Bacillus gaemokensis]
MNNSTENKTNDIAPSWLLPFLPFISAIFGGSSLWYTWFKYSDRIYQPEFYWYDWIRPILLVIMGILLLTATLLFILDKSSANNMCKLGFSMIPFILFSNLVIFLFKISKKAFDYMIQGNRIPSFNISYPSPIDKIILIALVMIIVRKILTNGPKTKNSN